MTFQLTAKSDVVVVVKLVDSIELSSNVVLLSGVVEVANGGVLLVTTEDLLGLKLLVGLVNILDSDDGQVAVVTEVTEGDTSTSLDSELLNLLLGDIKGNGDGEEGSVGHAAVGDNSKIILACAQAHKRNSSKGQHIPVVVSLVHESLKRRKSSVKDKLQVTELTLSEDESRESLGLLEELLAAGSIASDQVLEDTSVGLGKRRHGMV